MKKIQRKDIFSNVDDVFVDIDNWNEGFKIKKNKFSKLRAKVDRINAIKREKEELDSIFFKD